MATCPSETLTQITPVGNDIVDLACPENLEKHRDRRFVDRILNERERTVLASGNSDPHRQLWSFWTAKETAYKALTKVVPDIPAWPSHYDVHLGALPGSAATVSGTVACSQGIVTIRIFCAEDYLHCIGTAGSMRDLDCIIHGTCLTKGSSENVESASQGARNAVIRSVSNEIGVEPGRMQIVRPEGPRGLLHPLLLLDESPVPLDISLSHDGAFAGFARTPVIAGTINTH